MTQIIWHTRVVEPDHAGNYEVHCGALKTGHYIIGDNFVKGEPIFTTCALFMNNN